MAIPTVTPEVIENLLNNNLVEQARILVEQTKTVLPPSPLFIKHGLVKVGADTKAWLNKFITQDPDMLLLKQQIESLAMHKDTVLIVGETGTGKELLSRALHGEKSGPFVALNCAGMPEHLIESELFGHVAGAFTDAKFTKTGLMREANNGTLFLDEIGDLSYNLQAKFLRAIQEMSVRPVGSNKELEITCRIVCATHHNLAELVKQSKFRLDLFARISTFELHTKPIRDRIEDVPLIVKTEDKHEKTLAAFNPIYKSLQYPCNVRSIQQYVRRYQVLGILPTI
jgi:transcriptional regulator with PAS, ATPase and Fis domain